MPADFPSPSPHPYRTHTCGEPRRGHEGQAVRLSGWVHRKRDHGQLLFLDLRDTHGLVQCVCSPESPAFAVAESLSLESVVTITGKVVRREPQTVNPKMATGDIEVAVEAISLLSHADPLPLAVNSDAEFPEETRLRYRFLDLRRERLHRNILLRSRMIASLRQRMIAQGFTEFQTPILTASSPEGARDYLVPSRIHPGKFYALPQAPQQFKQLLMVAGFDRYFQIAPCFRDEDGRADRSPGEFYQLDFEMSFVTQEDVFQALEPVLHGVFEEFAEQPATGKPAITPPPFPRIPYAEAMLRYGTDKPDLRNPLVITDVTNLMNQSTFSAFQDAIQKGAVVRAVLAPSTALQPRSFFERLNGWAQAAGMPGLGYVAWTGEQAKGPLAKFLTPELLDALKQRTNAQDGDALFFVCAPLKAAARLAGHLRTHLGETLGLIEENAFRFCWVIDFPLFEWDEEAKRIVFAHNPFSMPQGGLEALLTQDPLDIQAYQYDIVCNGCELSSGAIRNHLPQVMLKAFEIAGYHPEEVEEKFGGLLNAFRFGAPPHGGAAPGIDRMVMLLTQEPNLREVIAFPFNQQAQDLLVGAPAPISPTHLKELGLHPISTSRAKL